MPRNLDDTEEDGFTRGYTLRFALAFALIIAVTLFMHVAAFTQPVFFTQGMAIGLSVSAIVIAQIRYRILPQHVIGALAGFYVACMCFLYGLLTVPADHDFLDLPPFNTHAKDNGGASAKAPPFVVRHSPSLHTRR